MGVMTMKMMSITSITSTIGVTLMSATGGGACLLFHCSLLRLAIVLLRGLGGGGALRLPPRRARFNSPDHGSAIA